MQPTGDREKRYQAPEQKASDEAESARKSTASGRLSGVADDREMLRAAVELTRDLRRPRPLIYWVDFLCSVVLGYASLAGVMLLHPPLLAVFCGVVAVLALYRALLFIHEITHLDHALLPGFRLAWNLLIGIPMMLPSFMYEKIHIIHHTRTRYGTEADPEYLPLTLMKPWTLPLFLIVAILMPIGLLLRFGLLGPVSILSPKLRRLVIARFSGLQMNPRFERRPPDGAFARQWRLQEIGATLLATAFIATAIMGLLPLKLFFVYLFIISGVALLNQIRTLVAHLWENDGSVLTLTAQYLDSTNVTFGIMPCLWAPVGLRFHALHHLLPSLPYHALGQAHSRISAALGANSVYHRANYRSLNTLVIRFIESARERFTGGDLRSCN
jgi:fatty acid desaturase